MVSNQKVKYKPMLKLRAMRALKGFTQEDLAKKAGLHRNTVSQYESGLHQPKIENLQKVAGVLDCKLEDII